MKANLRKIEGNWDIGYALDKHMLYSNFLGHNEAGYPMFDNHRTEAGEAVYQLKYRSDWDQVEPLADAIVEHIAPKLGPIGLVIPVPASITRARQPVYEVAAAVAKRIKVESFEGIICKTAAANGTVALKNLGTKDEKVAALEGRFIIEDTITNEGCWNALVVDDLFDSGASMEAVCASLRTYRKIDKIYVATLTWK
ncbi:putative amidophosphoribosyltransferase [Rhodovulum iodosum]|uniref:Amidophosphoribosyltransferase n=1 Tax=Rhodovulum iodosum TaxID=68291 RepID=A0ABV3XTR7_9RHOB|nr:ComF family protein [Rhodovulum robiginosum]RSK39019.1 ComF family protein [Rhodovulum robiginosum]